MDQVPHQAKETPTPLQDVGMIVAARRCVNWARAVAVALRESATAADVASWIAWTKRPTTDASTAQERMQKDARWLADRCDAFARDLEARIPRGVPSSTGDQ